MKDLYKFFFSRVFAPFFIYFILGPAIAIANTNQFQTNILSDDITPKIRSWETDSGVRVVMYEIKSIPLIDLAIDIDSGSRWDPRGLEGLSAMTNSMVFKGTTGYKDEVEMTEEDISEFIAEKALIRSASTDRDKTSLRFRFLSDREIRQPITEFVSRVLAFPKFDKEIFDREKDNSISRLEDSLTKPQTIVTKNLWKTMYPEHPYGRSISSESLNSITVDKLESFHQTFWVPSRITLSIVGDIDFEDAKKLAIDITSPLSDKLFENESPISIEVPELLPAVSIGGKTVLKIPHPAAQSHIWMGLPILARHETDKIFPMFVANHILGGSGFGSRLTEEIREKRGLSYSVFSAFRLLKQKGPFFVGLQTGKKNSDEAINVMMRTVKEFIDNGPTDQELETAKKGLVGGFALRLDSNSKILENLAQIVFYNLPLDYLDNWTLRIRAVTLEDVKNVLKEKINLNNASLVVVGYKE